MSSESCCAPVSYTHLDVYKRQDKLRLVCDPVGLPFETTADVAPTTAIIGQPRATRALEFGMGLKGKGYNIYVMGSSGTGRSMAIRHFLRERCGREPTPPDWIYIHNFDAPHRPRAMSPVSYTHLDVYKRQPLN